MRHSRADEVLESVLGFTVHGWVLLAVFVSLVGASGWNILVTHKALPYKEVDDRIIDVAVYAEVIALLSHISLRLKSLSNDLRPSPLIVSPGTVDQELRELIESGMVKEGMFICYGTNRFGKILDEIQKDGRIRVKVVVCHPDKVQNESDRAAIESTYRLVSAMRHAEIFYSVHFPTIRAALLKGNNNRTLYCSIQPYLISDNHRGVYGGYPGMRVADSYGKEMNELKKLFLSEFNRLASINS